jgi:hypothetical protein
LHSGLHAFAFACQRLQPLHTTPSFVRPHCISKRYSLFTMTTCTHSTIYISIVHSSYYPLYETIHSQSFPFISVMRK